MKVLLTTLNARHIHSNLAIRYLYHYCRKSFPELEFKEFTINQDPDYCLGEIYKGKYQIVCFSCYIWNITETLKLASNLKKVAPETIIVLGGPEVSFDPQEIMELNQTIDYIIIGEGEVTFKELLNYLVKSQGQVKEILGLAYRQGEKVIVNGPRPLIEDLGTLPFPYGEEDLAQLKDKIIYYESSRGCPFGCTYCLSSITRKVRFFPLERVKNDLKVFLAARVKQVKFVDRTFNVKKSHSLEIMRFLQEHDNGYTNFHFEITADLLDDETLAFLKNVRPGLFQFEIGVQSTNPATLQAIRRTVDFQKLKKTVKTLASYKNIHLHLDLIAGLPFEDYKSFKKSFDQVYALRPDHLQLGFLKLLKGTPLRQEEARYGYLYKSEAPYEVLANNYISFGEILRLKAMENILELYYNSHHFTYALEYIIQNFYPAPADFYEDFSQYWEKQGLHHLCHSKTEQYKILLEFYRYKNFPQLDLFNELLKLDFHCHLKSPLPAFLAKFEPAGFKKACHKFLQDEANLVKYLPHYLGLPLQTIKRRVHFELFAYDLTQFIADPSTKDLPVTPTVLLFDYQQADKRSGPASFYKVPLEFEQEERA